MNETSSSILKTQTGHVLVVDDEEKNRELLRDLVEEQGHQVTEAENGEQALERVKKALPDVILLDVMMPGMDGFEVCRRLKDNPETAPIPILLVTSLTERSERLTGIEAGANDFISKPIDTQDVLLRVRNAVYTRHLYNTVQENYERVQKLEKEERELLEDTLGGSVKVLTEVLSMSNPIAFRRSTRIRGYVRQMAKALSLKRVWEFELAAQLSHIGCFTMEESLLEKVYNGTRLTEAEFKAYAEYPKISASLIEKIPRLELVSEIIASMGEVFTKRAKGDNFNDEDRNAVGGYLIKVAVEFDQFITRGASINAVITRLKSWMDYPSPSLLKSIKDIKIVEEKAKAVSIRVPDLNRNMMFLEDVFATDGMLPVSKGESATYPVIARLRNYAKGIGVVQPFKVALQVMKRTMEYNK